jgi:hypothetical protein
MTPAGEPKGMRQVRLYLIARSEAQKAGVAQAVRDAGGEVLYVSTHGKYLVVHVPLSKLAVVAGRDEVYAIERVLEGFEPNQDVRDIYGGEKARITMAQIRELCGADRLKAAGGYEGLGVRVAFWDDAVRADHIDLIGRPLTIIGPQVRGNAVHGTAIAGILCGEGRGNPEARGLLPLGGLVFASSKSRGTATS